MSHNHTCPKKKKQAQVDTSTARLKSRQLYFASLDLVSMNRLATGQVSECSSFSSRSTLTKSHRGIIGPNGIVIPIRSYRNLTWRRVSTEGEVSWGASFQATARQLKARLAGNDSKMWSGFTIWHFYGQEGKPSPRACDAKVEGKSSWRSNRELASGSRKRYSSKIKQIWFISSITFCFFCGGVVMSTFMPSTPPLTRRCVQLVCHFFMLLF